MTKNYSKIMMLAVALMASLASFAETKIDGIFYNLDSEKLQAQVTFQQAQVTFDGSATAFTYTGAVTIPQTVSFQGKDYTVTSIGEMAFFENIGLTSVTIPNSVTAIGDKAFNSCRSLTSIEIPSTVVTIGEGAFGCDVSTYGPVIMSFAVDAANANYASDGSLLTNKAGDTVYGFASAKANLVIPEGVTTIANYGLSGSKLSNVRTIALPNTLTTIGDYGIFGQTNVASISIPSSVTYVGSDAFGKWEAKQTVSFHCTRDYALVNFAPRYSADCSAKITYLGE